MNTDVAHLRALFITQYRPESFDRRPGPAGPPDTGDAGKDAALTCFASVPAPVIRAVLRLGTDSLTADERARLAQMQRWARMVVDEAPEAIDPAELVPPVSAERAGVGYSAFMMSTVMLSPLRRAARDFLRDHTGLAAESAMLAELRVGLAKLPGAELLLLARPDSRHGTDTTAEARRRLARDQSKAYALFEEAMREATAAHA